jgi:hypothetical protein
MPGKPSGGHTEGTWALEVLCGALDDPDDDDNDCED